MLVVRRILSIIALGGLAALAWYSVLQARADVSFRENKLESVRTATRLVPGNAYYHEILAEHLEAEGANPDSELEIATKLSPRESRYWIRRGFRAEVEQKYKDSGRYLFEAYRVDRGFDPRWALMNYYFRRNDVPEFWKFTREALEMSYGNLDPIFRLCLVVSEDPSAARQAFPPRRDILLAFLDYLLRNQLVESSAAIAGDLTMDARADEVPVLLEYCGKQMGHNNESALTVWNALCRRRLLPFAELAPDQGQIVTNGDFSAAPLQQGFDWRYGTDDGVTVGPMDAAQGASVDISGKQPDTSELIEQQIPLAQGKQYVLNYEYRLVTTQPDSGLRWVLRGSELHDAAGSDPMASSSVLSATDWSNGQMTFSAGQRSAAQLVLLYRRAPGTIRWKGTVQIRRVAAALAPGRSMEGKGDR